MILELLTAGYINIQGIDIPKNPARIIGQRCAQCHNQAFWELNWLNESNVRRYRPIIIKKLQDRSMPPGNVTGITDEERLELIKWLGSLY